MSVLEKSAHIRELSILERFPYWKGVHFGEVSELERCVHALERCPY
jgi:hypothetical protein